MKKVEFSAVVDNEVEVTVDGEKYGTLRLGYERDDEDEANQIWIFWDKDDQDGVSYSDDLEDTKEAITDEIQNFED